MGTTRWGQALLSATRYNLLSYGLLKEKTQEDSTKLRYENI